MNKMRIGFGYDVHQLQDGKAFWLGGIKLNHNKGSVGHSDADVLIHAICDALLGAANLGDIGKHFPNTSPQYKNIDSKILLKKVVELLSAEGYTIGNIDSTVTLEKPKINPHIPEMKKVLANTMNILENDISIKATTNETMGYIGREEGVCAYAIVLINEKK
ncbi:MAG: 2-C-methyl-D-erythritol 2,4-cyclodiphosphate synthase [Bacteroidia bacterium]|nr:2-C-methyl-D-erythritol 2,4-cyclodiphosphate synthase [Bacteroidia bacterium]